MVAGGALVVIYGRVHIFDLDRARLAGTLAELTAYASDVTVGADGRALVDRHTADPMARIKRDKTNELFGACGRAYAASDT